MSNLDAKINKLNPGGFFLISKNEYAECIVERSGDGKTLRFVRTFPDGSFEVFKETGFNAI